VGFLANIVPFTKLFYGVHFLFTSNMGSMKRGSSLLNHFQAQGKGGPLGGPLFALAHYRAFLKTITQAPKCVFPSLVDDTHIVGTMNEVVLAFNHLLTQLALIGLKVNVSTCKLWNPLRISSSVNFLGLHFSHRWLTHFGCANGFLQFFHAFFG
jgi:hypothetical protein